MRFVILALALLAAACAKRTGPPLQLANGDYAFDGVVGSRPVSGQLTFTDTEYRWVSNHGVCTGMPWQFRMPARPYQTIRCGPVSLRLHNRKGELDKLAFATFTDSTFAGYKQTCVAWATNAQGQRYCTGHRQDPVYRTHTSSGYIDVIAVTVVK